MIVAWPLETGAFDWGGEYMGNGTVIRVPRHSNFSVISNIFLRDKDLSLKAKGLMAFMLSLPPDWDYSIQGLMVSTNTGETQIRSCINELKQSGYLVVSRERDVLGRLQSASYVLLENPKLENQVLDNQVLDNEVQISTNLNKDLFEINTDIQVAEKKKVTYQQRFKKPTLDEVKAYISEKGYNVDAQKFFDYYESTDWHFKDGKPVRYWKQCIVTWNSRNKDTSSGQPSQHKESNTWVDPKPTDESFLEELKREAEEFLYGE